MRFNYYNNDELEFYIYVLDTLLEEYGNKVEMLENLKDEFVTELQTRGRDQMDTLYIGDIPTEFHFARFGSNYIDLFNTNQLVNNQTYTYYRIYMYDNLFEYDVRSQQGGYYNETLQDVSVSQSKVYRRDFGDICIIVALMVGFGVWLLNLMTSLIRKGGVLGGLF